MAVRHNMLLPWVGRVAICALALGACATPAVVPPTAAPTEPATATALPPTAAATPQNTAAALNIPVAATSILITNPQDIAFDADGNFYVSDGCDILQQIYKIDPFGLLTLYAGVGGFGFSGDGGPARSADIACPAGLAFDRDGNLYVADGGNNRIRRIDRNGVISTVAGSDPGGFGGDGGPATSAQLAGPNDIAFDSAGNLYIADVGNNRIRKVDQAGIITTVAGNGTSGLSGDGGPATAAGLNLGGVNAWPGIAFDAQGNLYISDSSNARVRKVDQQGIITTMAGTGEPGVSGDSGPATAAELSVPTGLAFDAGGNLYIACAPGNFTSDARIRKVDARGIITTVVGTGEIDFSGDGGPARSATLANLNGIAFDPKGNLYIADTGNQRVRKVDKNGIITTVAGGHF